MSELSKRARAAMFIRSFAIQGSWNYRTLIGNGFAFVLLPALREVYSERPAELRDAVARHADVFNSHPYLAGIAAGAVARLEAEATDPHVIQRFKTAMRGSLGTLGDGLVWAGWRPVCAMVALLLVFAGLPWWLCAIAFLGLYNAGHIALRVWGFAVGYGAGLAVGERLRRSRLLAAQNLLAGAGAFLLGVLLPVAIGTGLAIQPPPPLVTAAALAAALAGLLFDGKARVPLLVAMLATALGGISLGWLP